MFKQFFWKLVLCVAPVLLSLWVVWDAYANDKFKRGVDLSGGTILVYEIDTRKQLSEGKEGFDPKRDTNLLAESLKRRIDPNDLYNIVIRPAGGEGRVEIILPTGGVERAEEAQKAWNALLEQMADKYKLPKAKLIVRRGQIQRLQDRIVQLVQEEKWGKKLFSTEESRKQLIERAIEPPTAAADKQDEARHLALLYDLLAKEEKNLKERFVPQFWAAASKGPWPVLPYAVTVTQDYYRKDPTSNQVLGPILGNYDYKNRTLFDYKFSDLKDAQGNPIKLKEEEKFRKLLEEVKRRVDDVNKNKEIEAWFKQQAWRKVVNEVLKQHPILEERRASFERIPADAIDELVGRVELKGDFMGQAFVNVIEPMAGDDLLKALKKHPAGFLSGAEVREFVLEYYGPSPRMIEADIEAFYKEHRLKRDLTFEKVQQIKDLVSKVGSLEFRILANSVDDAAAIKDAEVLINSADEAVKSDLKQAQDSGLPPPAPRKPGSKEPKVYTIKLRGQECDVAYSWVELGPQERQQLGLNNGVKEPGRGQAWVYMNKSIDWASQIASVGANVTTYSNSGLKGPCSSSASARTATSPRRSAATRSGSTSSSPATPRSTATPARRRPRSTAPTWSAP